jgi:DNA-binding XRE family transcriptional regulator
MVINAKDRFAELPEDDRKAILKRADVIYAEEMSLAELRKVRQRSQAKLAKKLGVKQAAVSRLERRADMYVSTLRGLIEAMGGSLQIIAQFPDRPAVSIGQFAKLKQAR